MNYLRQLVLAVIILVFLVCAWYGAEMLIYGQSQRSAVDTFIAIMISLSISAKLEKGVEKCERKREIAEKFANEFIEFVKKSEETKSGEDGNRKEA